MNYTMHQMITWKVLLFSLSSQCKIVWSIARPWGGRVMDLVKIIADLDDRADLHLARLLILIEEFSGSNGDDAIEGITKLAKLDFLLRYPIMLERALIAKNKPNRDVQLEDHEYNSVESEMVRYRFGPWDHRYREFLNILVCKDLIKISLEGKKVIILITDKGHLLAMELNSKSEFLAYSRRSKLLKRYFNLKATSLMNFIYATFPEVISLRTNEKIHI